MSKTQRHQQEALWELLNTELTYINKLTIAKDVCHKFSKSYHGFIIVLFNNIYTVNNNNNNTKKKKNNNDNIYAVQTSFNTFFVIYILCSCSLYFINAHPRFCTARTGCTVILSWKRIPSRSMSFVSYFTCLHETKRLSTELTF